MDVGFMLMGMLTALLALIAFGAVSFPAGCVMAGLTALLFTFSLVARAKGWD